MVVAELVCSSRRPWDRNVLSNAVKVVGKVSVLNDKSHAAVHGKLTGLLRGATVSRGAAGREWRQQSVKRQRPPAGSVSARELLERVIGVLLRYCDAGRNADSLSKSLKPSDPSSQAFFLFLALIFDTK